MKFLVIIAVFALVGFALWQRWKSLPPQTKQMWGAIFGMAGAIRHAKKQAQHAGDGAAPTSARGSSAARNLMLPCAQCGLHILESEGVQARGQFYCCTEHAV